MLVAILVAFARDGAGPSRTSASGAADALPGDGVVPPAAPAPQDWADVPIARGVGELEPGLARAVADGLAAARARIGRCVAVDLRNGPAGAPGTPAGAGPIELVLRLAPRSGAIHVVGVEPGEAGGASELSDCARRQLDGAVIPAEGAVPGRRHRLLVRLP